MDKYIKLEKIGEGSFGRVYKAKVIDTNEIVAYKVIPKHKRSPKELKSLRQECEIQRNLSHPNIIRMLDSFETEDEIVVVSEYVEKELYDILGKEGYLPEDRVCKIVSDLVSALYYLHSNRVLHRDLKPQNVLIESDGTAKLCDFGFARSMSTGTHVLTSIKGTPLYMAPELIEECPYDHNADLWSLGCIAYELLVGSTPFFTNSILRLVSLIRHEPIKWPDFLSENCISFLQGLLEKNPNRRLTWPDLLYHPFVAKCVLVLDENTLQLNDIPSLTHPLTASQCLAKENQKKDLSSRAGDNSRFLIRAIIQIEEHEGKKQLSNSSTYLSAKTYGVAKSESPRLITSNVLSKKLSGDISNDGGSTKMIAGSSKEKTSTIATGVQADFVDADEDKNSDSVRQVTSDVSDLAHTTKTKKQNSSDKSTKSERIGSADAINKEGKLLSNNVNTTLRNNSEAADSFICDDPQPIECEEWLVFLQKTMEEVMEGEVEEMKQNNFVTFIVGPLRNPSASCRVIEYVACLLSLPFVVGDVTKEDVSVIKKVYLEVKAVSNLVYASKLLSRRRDFDSDSESYKKNVIIGDDLRSVSELKAEELQALECICLLLCHLVHADETFLVQFCDAIAYLDATSLLQQFLLLGRRKVRIVVDLLAILTHVLRMLPENASLIEKIVLGNNAVDLSRLLTHRDPNIRSRSCLLLRLLGRYSCRALQGVWTARIRIDLEALLEDSMELVRKDAEATVKELQDLFFYEAVTKYSKET